MQKRGVRRSRTKAILLTLAAVLFTVFFIIPLALVAFDGSKVGNVALIPIEGVITGSGAQKFGQASVSAKDIVQFIQDAVASEQIEVIVLEINSPGGSAVASDEIAAAIKQSSKPVLALIGEMGASGGYWIASAADRIFANRMSITGSIGVISSYLEFSGLMEEYGVGYERFVAGKYKDLGSPYKQATTEERQIFQAKLDTIHQFFIQEVATNREMSEAAVKKLATGEFLLGVEALDAGLIDQLGNLQVVEEFMKQEYQLTEVKYVTYQREIGFLDILAGVFSDVSFAIGEGIASIMVQQDQPQAIRV